MGATKSDSEEKNTGTVDLKKHEKKSELPKEVSVPDVSLATKLQEAKVQYRINGLSPDREKDAIKMLDAGKDIAEVMDIFGIARSDIMTLNVKK